MEVDRTDFPAMLPTMLKHISNAHFVAFDLELSGIPTRQRNAGGGGRQTLQQRYTEVKRAAETFHILQFGLTCVEQDERNEKYLLRSYNFNLSPLISDGLDVEREFTYSTGAVDFLLSVGYSMDSPFKDGVPYLTREETTAARKRAMKRSDRASIPDIVIRPDDEKALKFMKRVRKEIDAWMKLPRVCHVSRCRDNRLHCNYLAFTTNHDVTMLMNVGGQSVLERRRQNDTGELQVATQWLREAIDSSDRASRISRPTDIWNQGLRSSRD